MVETDPAVNLFYAVAHGHTYDAAMATTWASSAGSG
jgi:hypothetical protein